MRSIYFFQSVFFFFFLKLKRFRCNILPACKQCPCSLGVCSASCSFCTMIPAHPVSWACYSLESFLSSTKVPAQQQMNISLHSSSCYDYYCYTTRQFDLVVRYLIPCSDSPLSSNCMHYGHCLVTLLLTIIAGIKH